MYISNLWVKIIYKCLNIEVNVNFKAHISISPHIIPCFLFTIFNMYILAYILIRAGEKCIRYCNLAKLLLHWYFFLLRIIYMKHFKFLFYTMVIYFKSTILIYEIKMQRFWQKRSVWRALWQPLTDSHCWIYLTGNITLERQHYFMNESSRSILFREL